jgi:hypothetical protein
MVLQSRSGDPLGLNTPRENIFHSLKHSVFEWSRRVIASEDSSGDLFAHQV